MAKKKTTKKRKINTTKIKKMGNKLTSFVSKATGKSKGELIDFVIDSQTKHLKKKFREDPLVIKGAKYLKKKTAKKKSPKKKTTKKIRIKPEDKKKIMKFKNKIVDMGVDFGAKFLKEKYNPKTEES